MSVHLDDLQLTPFLLVHLHYPCDIARFPTRKEARVAKSKKLNSENYIIVKVEYLKVHN